MSDGERKVEDGESGGSSRAARARVKMRVFGADMVDPAQGKARPLEWVGDGVDEDTEVTVLNGESGPLAKRRIEDEEVAGDQSPGKGKRRLGLGGLTLLMGCAAIVLAVIGVSVMVAMRKDPPGRDMFIESLRVVDEKELSPAERELGLTHAEAEDLVVRARGVTTLYLGADSVEEALPFIRNGEALRTVLEKRWESLHPGVGGDSGYKVAADKLNERIVLFVGGKDRDGKPFELVFVREGDELLVDWEASMALGEVAFEDLAGVSGGHSVKVRAVVEVSTFHPLEFPDDKYRCYRLRDLDNVIPVFGYVEIGSKEAETLAELLNEDSMLFDPQERVPMILEVTNTGQGSSGQFEITRVIQKGWVEP